MRLWVRNNSLSLVFGILFLATVFGQSLAGHRAYNQEQGEHDLPTVSYARYLTSSDFGEAVTENWQSEFLQFSLFILATIWLIQRGSNESKKHEEAGLESDEQQLIGEHAQRNSPRWAKLGGWRTHLYSNSLLLLMMALFFTSWFAQSATGWTKYNEQQKAHNEDPVSWGTYVSTSDFWEDTLQNWQSEFLAVGTMAVFTVYLRQRGSPESKPVGAPHTETGSSG
jgi:hypothetical protein